MAYATVEDVQARATWTLSAAEQTVCATLLDDAATLIDGYGTTADDDAKKIVSCRMVIRVLAAAGDSGVPLGATQGSMSALGYSQSWTLGTGSTNGELYLSRMEKQMLGIGRLIGSRSPVEDLVVSE